MKEVIGIMLDFNPREYSIRELYESYNRKEIILSPKFQRRPVWEAKAKSYFIDSIIGGFPIPRIFIRECSTLDMTVRREIVDGQQRLKTIFDFLNDGFQINKIHNETYGGCYYSDLPEGIRRDFLKYPISAILLIDLSDNEIFDIFSRLNTYSVKLNDQELLNSQFFGAYKKLIYSLALEYHSFWIESGIITEKRLSRMEDAKIISELISIIINQKIVSTSVSQTRLLYKKYDDEFNEAKQIEERFKYTLDFFASIYEDNLKETVYNTRPMFFSTFLALYHLKYGIKEFGNDNIELSKNTIPRIKSILDEINEVALTPADDLKNENLIFVETLKKHTTSPNERKIRTQYIIDKLVTGINQ